MKTLTTLIALNLVVSLYSQDIDSVQALNNKAEYFISVDKDSTRYYGNLSYQLNNQRFPVENALSKLYVGMYYKRHGAYDTAYVLFNDAKEIFEERELPRELGRAYWYLGKTWHELHQFERAVPLYLKAFEQLELADDYRTQVKVLNGLGVMSVLQGEYIESLEWYQKCLEIVIQNDLQDMVFRVYSNIAGVYEKTGDSDLALVYYKKGIGYHKKETESYHITATLGNIGDIYKNQGNADSASHYFELAVQLSEEWNLDEIYVDEAKLRLSNYEGSYEKSIELLKRLINTKHAGRKAIFLTELTDTYKSQGALDSAIHYGIQTYEFNISHHSNVNAKSTAAMLAELYEAKGEEELALYYQKKYIALNDSIFHENDLRKNRDLMIKIETIEAANEVELLRSQLEVKELKQTSFIRLVTSVIILVFLMIWFYIYRQKVKRRQLSLNLQKQQLELDKKNSELQLQTLHMARHTNTMNELEEGLKKLVSDNDGVNKQVQRLINSIKIGRNMDKEWEKFDSYFSDVHKGYIDQLKVKFPSLTLNDVRLCTLLRLQLSNSEIATIMNIETKSIVTAKYRLRKKLALDNKEDLIAFLHGLE